jgi:hypothetical protein
MFPWSYVFMLVRNKGKEMEQEQEHQIAKFVRFQNGDDVITELVEMGENNIINQYMLVNPLKVIYLTSPNPGYLQIAFLPWVFPRLCENQEFVIDVRDVMLVSDVSKKMSAYYYESVDQLQDEIAEVASSKTAVQEAMMEDEFDEEIDPTKITWN